MSALWREALDVKTRIISRIRNERVILPQDPNGYAPPQGPNSMVIRAILSLMQKSDLYWWSPRMADSVMPDTKAPGHVGHDSMRMSHLRGMADRPCPDITAAPSKSGMYCFERSWTLADPDYDNTKVEVVAIMWDSYQESDPLVDIYGNPDIGNMRGFSFFAVIKREGGYYIWPLPWTETGRSIGESVKDSNTPEAFLVVVQGIECFMIESWKMLQERMELESPEIDRYAVQRAERRDINPEVRVVQWRKVQYQYPADHEPSAVDWSCHWQVKSHQRRYKSGKVVTVRPYIKGDRTKPFRAPAEIEVNMVVR